MRNLVRSQIKITALVICIALICAPSVMAGERIGNYEEPSEIADARRMFTPSRVIIEDYFIEGGGLLAGEVSTAVLVLRNTSQTSIVNSVILTGWIESAAPVEFTGTNQVFAGSIPPGGNAVVTFEYYTRMVDITASTAITAGFTILYSDDAIAGNERVNNVSLRLPILSEPKAAVADEDMQWPESFVSDRDRFLASDPMQIVYASVLVFCVVFIIGILLSKLIAFRRRVV